MELTGTIRAVYNTQVVSDKFKKREFVLTIEASSPYPQHLPMQVTQDKCNILDGYSVGDEVKVSINLRGKEFNGQNGVKYFLTIEAWRIEKLPSTF